MRSSGSWEGTTSSSPGSLEINGQQHPPPLTLEAGHRYHVRLINITESNTGDVSLGGQRRPCPVATAREGRDAAGTQPARCPVQPRCAPAWARRMILSSSRAATAPDAAGRELRQARWHPSRRDSLTRPHHVDAALRTPIALPSSPASGASRPIARRAGARSPRRRCSAMSPTSCASRPASSSGGIATR